MNKIKYETPVLIVYEENDLKIFEAAAGTTVEGDYNNVGNNNCFLGNITICIKVNG